MTQEQQDERRELKATITSLEAKLVRRDKTIEDKIRELNRIKAVILDMEEDKRISHSKNIVLMQQINSIDRESLM